MKRRQPEAAIQRALVEHLQLRGNPDCIWTASANGGKRDKITGRNLKLMGVRAGWPDMEFFLNGRGVFLELKAPNGVGSVNQTAVGIALQQNGFKWAIVYGLDAAIWFLESEGILTKGGVHVRPQTQNSAGDKGATTARIIGIGDQQRIRPRPRRRAI
jgi:hypothetical protein